MKFCDAQWKVVQLVRKFHVDSEKNGCGSAVSSPLGAQYLKDLVSMTQHHILEDTVYNSAIDFMALFSNSNSDP
jgi:hypothetical protein